MTGVNVAFRIPGDSSVLEKIDNPLTASPPEFAAAIPWIFFATRLAAVRSPN